MGSIARARTSLLSLAYCLSPVLTSAVRGCSPNLASSADPSVAAIKQNTTQIAQQRRRRRRGQPQSSPHNSTPFAAAAFHLIAVDFWGFDRRRDGRQTEREMGARRQETGVQADITLGASESQLLLAHELTWERNANHQSR